MDTDGDIFEHFLLVQDNPFEGGYEAAFKEVVSGKKKGHWIWYIFPVLRRLATSRKGVMYGIKDREEASLFLRHYVLGERLRKISKELLNHEGISPYVIFGERDAEKVRSCMTLFDDVSKGDVFGQVLDKLFEGIRCEDTLEEICREKNPEIDGPYIVDDVNEIDRIVEANFLDKEFDVALDKEDYYAFRDNVNSLNALVVSTNVFSKEFLNAFRKAYRIMCPERISGLLVYMVNEAKDKKHYVNVTMDDMSLLLEILAGNTCNMRWGISKNFQSREGEKSKLTVTVIAGISDNEA